jgi:hypothetical protein
MKKQKMRNKKEGSWRLKQVDPAKNWSWRNGQIVCKVCKHFLVKGRQDNRVPLKPIFIDGKAFFPYKYTK